MPMNTVAYTKWGWRSPFGRKEGLQKEQTHMSLHEIDEANIVLKIVSSFIVRLFGKKIILEEEEREGSVTNIIWRCMGGEGGTLHFQGFLFYASPSVFLPQEELPVFEFLHSGPLLFVAPPLLQQVVHFQPAP